MAYVLASITLGVALLSNPLRTGADATPAANTPLLDIGAIPSTDPGTAPGLPDDSGKLTGPTGTPRPTTSAPPASRAPAGFQPVTGPAGIHTVIPVGWSAGRTTGPGAMQAADPGDAGRYVKYGGSAAPALGIDASHVQYENGFAVKAKDYRRIVLSTATYGGHEAVEWEFEHTVGPSVRPVRSLYWRAGGKEYFVLACAPAAQWSAMKPIYDTMVANADP
jgi:hypothetical protein